MAPDGRILGESVINEIDWDLRCANFRIAIVHPTDCGQGIGTWAAEVTRDFAFEKLKRHRMERQAYSFHPRAEKTYRKAGFHKEGVVRDAVPDGEQYADIIQMAMREDWRRRKEAAE